MNQATLRSVRALILFVFGLSLGWFGAFVATGRADAPRVLPAGAVPKDTRLGPLRDLDTYAPFNPSATPADWAKRAERLRRQLLVANGLWPMPTKTAPNAVIHGKIDRDGYTVEAVSFESYPGHYVTGSLYRPLRKPGKRPAVMCPHGHWPNGRFNDSGEESVKQQIVTGAERFEKGGRYPLQARCVQLAKMGCVVLMYDMVGYADSVQLSQDLAHHFVKQRPEMDTPENWGFYSTQAELRQQSVMGLQTYNSIRALDWLSSLSDVDPARIGVTGASGGGTQTFILCAIDQRPAAAFPAVMLSTSMQGGCTCENCSLLRLGTGNIEIAALIAPRPLGMTGADDWTREIMTKGFPELKQHYAMLGAPDAVMAKALIHFPHNYNYVSRELMYQWFNKHLGINEKEPVIEDDYRPVRPEYLSVWDDDHPKPRGGDDYERSLVRWMTADSDKQIEALKPSDAASLAKFREVVGGAWDVIVGRGLPPAGAIEYEKTGQQDRGEYLEFPAFVRYKSQGEELPVVFLHPKNWNGRVAIWVHEKGKAGLYGGDGAPTPDVRRLLAAGVSVVGADLLYQGEFLADGKPLTAARRVSNPREFAGYTYGYNASLLAQRAQDILSLISYCKFDKHKPEKIYLLALDGAGPWGAAALAQAAGAVDRAVIDTAGFRFRNLKSVADLNFLPGAVKYGDLPAMLAAGAPTELLLAGEGSVAPDMIAAAYKAAGQAEKLHMQNGADKGASAVDWLLR